MLEILQWVRILIVPHPHQHLLTVFLILAIIVCVWCYLSHVVSLCISMTNDVEHLFICLCVILYLWWSTFIFFAHVENQLLSWKIFFCGGNFKTTEMYYFTVLEAGGLKSWCHQGVFLLEDLKENLFHKVVLTSDGYRKFLAFFGL